MLGRIRVVLSKLITQQHLITRRNIKLYTLLMKIAQLSC